MTRDTRVIGAAELIGRLESVPFSRWHLRPRVIVGSATFFDAFDALSLAFVLPVLVRAWALTTAQIGWLIAVGYLGQFVGAPVGAEPGRPQPVDAGLLELALAELHTCDFKLMCNHIVGGNARILAARSPLSLT